MHLKRLLPALLAVILLAVSLPIAVSAEVVTVKINGFRPIDEAIVTRGGVSVKEIDPKTMQSKLVRGLYFAGEVLDIDAYTGGFNLQLAFATGAAAGRGMAEHSQW